MGTRSASRPIIAEQIAWRLLILRMPHSEREEGIQPYAGDPRVQAGAEHLRGRVW